MLKMGCISSRIDINDRHPNIFQVTNVDDQGKPISPGKLQVTDIELVFYQKGKKPTKWPLRSLRKYGFDTEMFSFECGRRCPTGHGIYAFKCKKAEQLFNIVHRYITGNVPNEDPTGVDHASNSLPPQPTARRPPFQTTESGGYLNPSGVPVPVISRPTPTGQQASRPGSVSSSNGPLSPSEVVSVEHNNNKRNSVEPAYTNSVVIENGLATPLYANLSVEATEPVGHVYMNIETNNTKDITKEDEAERCYANIDTKYVEILRPSPDTQLGSAPTTPTILYATDPSAEPVREVNYAELDLDNGEPCSPPPALSTGGPESSPKVPKKSYAMIDFQKTTALSHSINPMMTEDEGSRKTRHNSTINYNGLE
ncbi:unnamed protein product [Acanthoscelides obtectus]|uniref:IRS-type PTB domain-containing protein n=1 Tax=Acanthoscelides obtectus TaxID=200917 RepID=A0A9P0NYE6_ACAOB|nr:unnamed protein product [Acanthoscelides obtectus]CAK1625846.1 Fibroblast growth factor receptor substrate 2 [Acanthoscelides obtectus]